MLRPLPRIAVMGRRSSKHRQKTRPPFEGLEPDAFDWTALVDTAVHELKVAIAEALDWIGEPLSETELWMVLDLGKHEYYNVQYHAKTLEELGLLREVWERKARGATEVYYAAKPLK